MKLLKIVTFAPPEFADKIREALGKSGAGKIGEYSFCSFSASGFGRYLPSENSQPFIGKSGEFAQTAEEKIEVTCPRHLAKNVVKILRENHPYEEPAIDIYPLISEEEL